MKLQYRALLWLIPGLALTYLGSQVFQALRTDQMLDEMAGESRGHLEAMARLNAMNMESSAVAGILDWMAEGEMDNVYRTMERQAKVEGVKEFTLYGEDWQVDFSSRAERKGQALEKATEERLVREQEVVVSGENGSFVIHRPLLVDAGCVECHVAWKEGEVKGATAFRFETDEVRKAEADWTRQHAQIETEARWMGIFTMAAILVVTAVLMQWVLVRLVGKPLGAIAARLRGQAKALEGNSAGASKISQGIAEGALQQASALEETSASLEEIAGMTRLNAENAEKATRLGRAAHEAANRGVTDMKAMQAAMESIHQSSGEIANIMRAIDEIAFQTNILALNAAVEAARAGESGTGFAVVADEVRNLARRSAQAARETSSKIEASLDKTRQGVDICHKVGRALEEIVEKTGQVDNLVGDMALASKEQSQGLQQLNESVAQMDQVTQQNASGAQESADAATALNRQALELAGEVDGLVTVVEGRSDRGEVTAEGSPDTPGRPGQGTFFPTRTVAMEMPDFGSSGRGTRVSRSGGNGHSPGPDRKAAALPAGQSRNWIHGMAAQGNGAAKSLPEEGQASFFGNGARRPEESQGSNGKRKGEHRIAWDEATMATGFPEVDAQHKKLIEAMNELNEALIEGKGKEEVDSILDFLRSYVVEHFGQEEALMAKHQCPTREKNCAAHKKFLEQFAQLEKEYLEGGSSTALALRLNRLASDWLVGHIVKVDSHLKTCQGQCALGAGGGGSPDAR